MAVFRLQRVLDLRRRREDEMRLRLATAIRAREAAEQRLIHLMQTELDRRHDLANRMASGRVDAHTIREAQQALDILSTLVTAQREAVRRAVMFEAEERAAAARAMSERKALDKLRERHQEAERVAAGRREALVIDEIATARAWRSA